MIDDIQTMLNYYASVKNAYDELIERHQAIKRDLDYYFRRAKESEQALKDNTRMRAELRDLERFLEDERNQNEELKQRITQLESILNFGIVPRRRPSTDL